MLEVKKSKLKLSRESSLNSLNIVASRATVKATQATIKRVENVLKETPQNKPLSDRLIQSTMQENALNPTDLAAILHMLKTSSSPDQDALIVFVSLIKIIKKDITDLDSQMLALNISLARGSSGKSIKDLFESYSEAATSRLNNTLNFLHLCLKQLLAPDTSIKPETANALLTLLAQHVNNWLIEKKITQTTATLYFSEFGFLQKSNPNSPRIH